MSASTLRKIAVIFGAGPGTGGALARALLPTHSLLLLSPSLPGSLPKLKLPSGTDDKVLAFSASGKHEEFEHAFNELKKKWPDAVVDVGVVNTGSGAFNPGNFLDQSEDTLRTNFERGL